MALDFNPSYQTADERVAEAHRILEMFGIGALNIDELKTREKDFVTNMQNCTSCSPAQLNWLRRIKEKYL